MSTIEGVTVGGAPRTVAGPRETRPEAPAERVIDMAELDAAGFGPAVPGGRALLAIDTTLGTSVALGVGSESGIGRIYEATSDDPRGHAERIGSLIARAFELSGASPADVAGVVAGIGPGPFTGLRVGIAAAHAYAAGRGVPVLPLHGHEAVALSVLEAGEQAAVRVVQDARRRELFVTEYSGLDRRGIPVRVADPHLVLRADYAPVDHEIWPGRIPAARLVQLALRRLAALGSLDGDAGVGPASAGAFEADRAVYLRTPDVKAPSAPKRVSGATGKREAR